MAISNIILLRYNLIKIVLICNTFDGARLHVKLKLYYTVNKEPFAVEFI